MTRKTRVLTLAVACLSTVLTPAAFAAPPAAAPGPCEWGYAGPTGPEDWWRQCYPRNLLCATGTRQTPIDLQAERTILRTPLPTLRFQYETRSAKVVNDGHAVQASFGNGPSLALEAAGQRYELLQLHFHTPSEHLINGQAAPLEVHLVHTGVDGSLAVVGVLLREGAANPVVASILAAIGKEPIPLDPASLLPERRDAYVYTGSLTTPPCTEGVSWHVLRDGLEVSREQIEEFRRLFPDGNARPVQPLNGRPVLGAQ